MHSKNKKIQKYGIFANDNKYQKGINLFEYNWMQINENEWNIIRYNWETNAI